MFFEKLLDLENDEKLWSFALKDRIPLWLNIRFAVFWDLQKEKYEMSNPHLSERKKILEIIKYFYFSIIRNLWLIKKNKIVIFGAGINNVKEGSVYINKLYDLYIENDSRFQLLESSAKKKYPLPRKYKDVYYSDLILMIAKILSYFIVLKREEYKTIENFLDYLKSKNLIKDSSKENWNKRLINICKKNKILHNLYKNFFKTKNVKAVILEDAHYGGNSVLIKQAKEAGIPVIEMQHGYIGKGHLAYNYNKEQYDLLKNYLPDVYLSFGEYWSERVRTPAKIINIGNAYLEQKASIESNKKDILLLISGGTMPEAYNEISQKLASLFKDKYKLLFRPHPSERPKLEERYSNLKARGFEFDLSNLYETLPNVEIIISYELSTVLYEALLFTENIYLINNEIVSQYIYDELPFAIISNIEEIEDLIKKQEKSKYHSCNVWESGAIKNFKSYFNYIVG